MNTNSTAEFYKVFIRTHLTRGSKESICQADMSYIGVYIPQNSSWTRRHGDFLIKRYLIVSYIITAGNNTYYSRSPGGVDITFDLPMRVGRRPILRIPHHLCRVHTFMLPHCDRYGHCNDQCVSNDVVMIVPQGLVVGVPAPQTVVKPTPGH